MLIHARGGRKAALIAALFAGSNLRRHGSSVL